MWENDFISDATEDAFLMLIAVLLVMLYSFFALGSCSPIHCRSVSAIIGLICVLLASTSGYALSFASGKLISRMHGILPFMLLGIGVDDMFVIVNSID